MQYGFTVKVKYQGPTNHKSARWFARLTRSGMMDALQPSATVSVNMQDRSPRDGAHAAAQAAMTAALGDRYEGNEAIAYGDLSPNEYVFIF